MSTGSLPIISGGQKYDSSATALAIVQRGSDGGITAAGVSQLVQLQMSGSLNLPYTVVAASYAINATSDHTIAATMAASTTLTLPPPGTVAAGRKLRIIRLSASNVLTVAPNGGEKINGAAANKTIATTAFLMIDFETDGTDWIAGALAVI